METPITVDQLRADWEGHPDLSREDLERLEAMTDDELRDALDSAFSGYERMWIEIFDSVRYEATCSLLGVTSLYRRGEDA